MQPAESNSMEFSTHTRNSPMPVCHLLDDGSVTSTKHENVVIATILTNLHNLSVCSVFLVSLTRPGLQNAGVPRAHEEELLNLGQLLHRLVSKALLCVSTWIRFGILSAVSSLSDREL